MADLDAELLALAGGDSSGEESSASPPRRKTASPKRLSESPPPAMSRKGTAKTRRVQRRKGYSEDEAESDVSARSASMSRSDSEAEFAPGEEKPLFPHEKYYYDAADKASILAKPEIEREEIIAQRIEQQDRHEQESALRRLLAARMKESAKHEAKNKRKASVADLDENVRKSSRQRTKLGGGRAGEASSAIAAYKQQREQKNLRAEQRRARAVDQRSDSPDKDYSDADADAESDNDFDGAKYKKRSPTPPKDDPPAELADIQRVRIGRDNFAQVIYTPGCEDALTGCYARVCLGPGRNPGVNEYRVCSIKCFRTGKPYAMTASNGRPFAVDMYIVAAHGKAERQWSFLECSMSRFTEDEWRRYRITMANEDCKIPTRGFINSKLAQIGKLINHKFTDVEIAEKMRKQTAMADKINRTAEKREIRAKIDDAMRDGDDDKVLELEEEFAKIMPLKLAFNTSLGRQETITISKEAERLGALNRRNQRLNEENVRKAQIAEMKARKAKRQHLLAPHDDLFSGSDISRTSTPVNGIRNAPVASAVSTPPPVQSVTTVSTTTTSETNGTAVPLSNGPALQVSSAKVLKKGLPVIRKAQRDDEILAEMDLGIDIDI